MDAPKYAQLLRETMRNLTATASCPIEVGATLRGATEACLELIPGSLSVDVLIIDAVDEYESRAATSPLAEKLDRVQERFGEGPCVSAAAGETVVRCDDLLGDSRWPRFAESAVAEGVRSMLSFQLFTHDGRAAALNVFGAEPKCFGAEAEALGAMLATHCAIALIADSKADQFHSALASRDLIGQAKGMVMERFDVDAVRAFELLRRLSQDGNAKLVDVAAQITTGGSDRTRT